MPLDGASFDWNVLIIKLSCRLVFRLDDDVNTDESFDKQVFVDGNEWDVWEFVWFVEFTDVIDWAVVIDDNFGKLKQARRTKWRALDFDGRITPGLEISARY